MKRTAILILCLVMIITCFTACKQDAKPATPESKTDVSTPAVVDQQPKEEVQAEADVSEPEQEEVKEPAEQAEENHEEAKPVSEVESKLTPKPTVQSKPAEKQPTDDEIHGDEATNYPTFVSDAMFQVWLKNGSGSYAEERDGLLQQTKNQTITYYRPIHNLEPYGTFEQFECPVVGQRHCYYYSQDNQLSLEIVVQMYNDSYFEQRYEDVKKQFENNQNGTRCVVSNEIEYYYECYEKGPFKASVYWQQFGKTHFAHVYKNQDKLQEIIPLLKLEQVTVKLNDDVVVK